MNNIKILSQNLFNGQDIFADYEALTSEEDKIVLCEEICKELAAQLDLNNTSNVERIAEFLDKIDVKYAMSAVANFISIDRLIKHDLDIKTKFEKFPTFLNKINKIFNSRTDCSDLIRFKLERKLIHNSSIDTIEWEDCTESLTKGKTYIVKRTEYGFEHSFK